MHRLPPTAPLWVRPFINIPFRERGRDRQGADCWGLFRLVYAQQFGLALPSYDSEYDHVFDAGGIRDVQATELEQSGRWLHLADGQEPERVGDLLVFRSARGGLHVGMAVSRDQMLHVERDGTSCLERWASPVWARRRIGVWRYDAPVQLTARPNPFGTHRIDLDLPAGCSLAEMIGLAQMAPHSGLRIFLDGQLVPPDRWALIRPTAGHRVVIGVAPEGGGKSPLRIIASIALIAAVALAPAAGGALFGAASFGAGTVGGALLAAGVGIAGYLAINALIPVSQSSISALDSKKDSPTIQGAGNEIRRFAAWPTVLGRHRITPPFGAVPYTEVVGDEQYLRCLFVLYGTVDIQDLKIGDTPIDEFEGVQYEIRNGYETDAPITLYPSTILEEAFSVLLVETAGFTTRTSSTLADEISVDITFPAGLVQYSSGGVAGNRTVTIEVQYKPVGTSTWLPVNGAVAATRAELDFRFRTPECPQIISNSHHLTRVAWGAGFPDAKPAYLPTTNFSWIGTGFVDIPVAGTYHFAVDSNDAADIEINGQIVASWYGPHAIAGGAGVPNFTSHNGSVVLPAGQARIRVRVEAKSPSTGALAVGWKRPGDAVYSIIPATSWSVAGNTGTRLLAASAYDTSGLYSLLVTVANRTGQIRRSLSFPVAQGQYDVRVRRVTLDSSSSSVVDQVYFTALRTIRNVDPIGLENSAKVALRIKATDQLNGLIDNFNFIATSIVPDWDETAGAWIERPSSNPASLFRHVLQGRPNRRPCGDDRINLEDLQVRHGQLETLGLQFNAVVDFDGTVLDRLRDIASAGRSSVGIRDGRYTMIPDVEQTVPVQHFTPRNSRNFRGRKVYLDRPHALRVQFINAEKGYARDERTVLDDGYQIDGLDAFGDAAPGLPAASKFETFEVLGCTSADEAWRHGRYQLAVSKLRPELFELETDVEHIVCSRGDLVLVTHDVPIWGLAAGRIKGRTLDGSGNLTALLVDELCPMAGGTDYRIRVRFQDGTSWTRDVVNDPGDQTTLEFVTPVPNGDPMPAIGDLWGFGEVGLESIECLVTAIDTQRDLAARLTLVPHGPGVHDADTGTIPDHNPGLSIPPAFARTPDQPVIENIRSDESVLVRGPDGTLRVRMVISIRRPSSTSVPSQFMQIRTRIIPVGGGAAQGPWTAYPLAPLDNFQAAIEGVEAGVTYEVSVRLATTAGRLSAPTVTQHTVVGKTSRPPDVQSFAVTRNADGSRQYTWALGAVPPDVAGVVIRYGVVGTAWASMTPLHVGVLQSSPAELNAPDEGTWAIAIKAVDTVGNESLNEVTVTATLGPVRYPNQIYLRDERLALWSGLITSGRLTAQNTLESAGSGTWAALAIAGTTWGGFTRWHDGVGNVGYTFEFDIGGLASNFAVDVFESHYGNLGTNSVQTSPDGITYGAARTFAEARVATMSGRWVKVTIQVTPATLAPVAQIVSMRTIVRAEPVVHEIQDLATSTLDTSSVIAVGDIRLPIPSGRFNSIRTIAVTFNGMGPGWSWELVDRDVTLGPRIRIYNQQGVLSHATIDATIRGL